MEEEQKPNSTADSKILLSCLEGNNKMAVFLALCLIILGIRQLRSVAVHCVLWAKVIISEYFQT